MTEEPLPTLDHDRYAIAKKLGEGGQAATFEAVDKRLGRLVVLKRFRVRGASSWKEVELAEREAKVLATLDHPNLPRYIEHFEERGELWLVTAKIEGESLFELRKKGVTWNAAEAIRFLDDARSALDFLHRRSPPVVHRDIKPGNVVLRPDGSCALIDFGSVRDRLKPEGGSTVVGTFGFMAPEQFQGRAMPATDVYAAGVTALVMLTGIEPEDLPHKGLAIDVRAALAATRIPKGLARALESMLEPDPDRRAKRIPAIDGGERSSGPPEARGGTSRGRDAARDEWSRTRDAARDEWSRTRDAARDEARQAAKSLKKEWDQAREWERAWKRSFKVEREKEREERRASRRVRKGWRRDELHLVDEWQRDRRRHPHGLPGFAFFFALLGLTIAKVAVTIAVGVVVPTLLLLLSLVFGRALRVAAQNVREASRHALRGVALTRRILTQRQEQKPRDEAAPKSTARVAVDKARVRVGSAPAGGVDVSNPDAEIEAEAEQEAEDAARGVRRPRA